MKNTNKIIRNSSKITKKSILALVCGNAMLMNHLRHVESCFLNPDINRHIFDRHIFDAPNKMVVTQTNKMIKNVNKIMKNTNKIMQKTNKIMKKSILAVAMQCW